MRYAGTTIMVDDVTAAVKFYKEAFGLSKVFADPDGTFTVLGNGSEGSLETGVLLAVEHWSKIEDFTSQSPAGGFRIGLEVDDVEAAFRKAVKAGATSAKEPLVRPWGQKVAIVFDPNGVIVELAEPTEYK
ncbi:VOC family protein [Streptomyces sp. NPDC058613]|uniref:VOC family protein n=2 Tax=Streptomyces TaxID=1883 RepID=UPI003661AD3C